MTCTDCNVQSKPISSDTQAEKNCKFSSFGVKAEGDEWKK